MGEAQQPYLLDTNILVALVRGGSLGKAIDAEFSLRANAYKPLISIVSVGEILALARKLNWGQPKTELLQKLLRELVWVEISSLNILNAYADIEHFSRTVKRTMGQNDVWIAATTKATGSVLLTTDSDFDHLHGTHITRVLIDVATGKAK